MPPVTGLCSFLGVLTWQVMIAHSISPKELMLAKYTCQW